MLRVFTTGQVAQVVNVNINTAIKWFDEGKLEGYRLPRSKERRIYRESLVAFMERHDISSDLLERFEHHRATRRPRAQRAHREQRGAPRCVSSGLRAALRIGPVEIPVGLNDLSLTGVALRGFCAPNQQIPEEFELSILDLNGARLLETRCQLIHLRREVGGLTLGCRFLQLDPQQIERCLSARGGG
ncbi:PilZ domain-containing protein [Myxococcota bacterium]|nr:PilZ domain-containing protein [Myxococcota bacterium]MBU1430260.1 PilZ domain-containing protein [Myxococcota bacterium]MBU1897185.1 PilZ domain-containing protein [Myxococcota bacterium]